MRYFDLKSLVVRHLGYCRYASYVTTGPTGVTQFFFRTTQSLILAIHHTHGEYFGIQHGLKRFHKYFIGGKYLGEALNGLSLLWRHQNIVNEVKNESKMADSSIIHVTIFPKVKQI